MRVENRLTLAITNDQVKVWAANTIAPAGMHILYALH